MADLTSITLPSVYYGSTWSGLTDCSLSSTGTQFVANLTSLRMQFRKALEIDSEVGLTLDSDEGTITITDADAWEFEVPPVSRFTLEPGVWHWSIYTIDADNIRETYYIGTLEVKNTPTP
jgi:hypothetical protein